MRAEQEGEALLGESDGRYECGDKQDWHCEEDQLGVLVRRSRCE